MTKRQIVALVIVIVILGAVFAGIFLNNANKTISAPADDVSTSDASSVENDFNFVVNPIADLVDDAPINVPSVNTRSGFSYEDGAAVLINPDTCGYTGLSVYRGSEDTNPGNIGRVDGYDRGDDDQYRIWSILEIQEMYDLESDEFYIVGDASDIAVAKDVTFDDDGVAHPSGFLAIGNSGNTFVIDPEAGYNFIIMRNGAFHLVPTEDLPGFTQLRVLHLECRGKIRPVKIVGDDPFDNPPFETVLIELP